MMDLSTNQERQVDLTDCSSHYLILMLSAYISDEENASFTSAEIPI